MADPINQGRTSSRRLLYCKPFYAGLLAFWFGARERIGRIGFYVTFAFAVTASVQLVGVYLVFASLIIPALTVRGLPGWRGLFLAYIVGGLSYVSGIVLSALIDLPTGAVTVWTMAVMGILAGAWFNRRRRS